LKIFVGNLSFDTKDEDLNRQFTAFGAVASASVVSDRDTGRSRGFGFVDMPAEAEAKAAIAALNGKDVMGRVLTVNESHPRESSGGSGGGRGGGSGGGGGGYRGGGGAGGGGGRY
jgi:RNA recognition motif-containing protein